MDDAEDLARLRHEDEKRKLIEEVRSIVETSLFRTYRNWGVIVLGTLSAVGIVVGLQARDMITSEIKTQIKTLTTDPVEQAKASAHEAQTITDNVVERVEQQREELNRRLANLSSRYDDMGVNYYKAESSLEGAQSRVKQLEDSLGSVQGKLSDADTLINFLKSTVQTNPVQFKDIERIDSRIKEIAEQMSKLTAALENMSSSAPNKAVISGASQTLAEIAKQQIQQIQETNQVSSDIRKTSVIYVQFAGGMRTTIQKITAKLKQEGWSVPGEQRLASAAGLHEVRYFYSQDKPAAEAVANDINTGASNLQIGIKPVVTKFVTINNKPNQGIIEVWLEVPN